MVCGLLTLAMPVWGAPTHMIDGVNTVNVLLLPLMGLGLALCAGGLLLLLGAAPRRAEKNWLVEG